MQITDLTVEVRNASLARVGQLMPSDLVGAKFIPKFNNIGSWTVRLASDHALADALRTEGAGIIVTGPQGVILSGPMTSAKFEQSIDNVLGDWIIEGNDDTLTLAERLAYPDPSTADVTLQLNSHDIRTGFAETVIKEYVSANLVDGPTVRKVADLVIETDLGRGSIVTGSARFDQLQELFYPLAQTGGIGFTIEQEDSELVFKVYEPVDRTSTIRLDLENGKLSKADYSYLKPKMTRAIVGGAGEAVERIFYEGTTIDSLASEIAWGRRIESFVDSRGTDVAGELVQVGAEALVDNGKTIVNLSVIPTDDQNMRYGFDWGLGDLVTVVVGDVEASAVVNTIGLSIEADGVRIYAEVGTPTPLSFESKLVAAAVSADTRISNIERNTTGYGVSTIYQPIGGTLGTQPTASGPFISGTYNRFGNMVHFSILVDFDLITSFGTGQYYVTLPYEALNPYQFRDGCLHDFSSGAEFQISGHIFAGSNQLFLNSADKVGSSVQDINFTSTSPVTLTTADNFHIAGTYEIAG